MERKFFLVAVAGGSGLRMGAQMPKQFLPLGGKPILRRTIERFLDACPDAKVVTVLPDSHMDWWKNYCLENGFTVPQVLVKGGFTRFHSVRNALERIPEGAIVAVHDGVRPFVSADLIRSMRDKMASCPALIPVVPCTDTLKAVRIDGDNISSVPGPAPDRSATACAQTPQMFHSEVLKAAYAQAFDTSFTDDASVVEKNGTPLSWCLGERRNIKVTTPEDLLLAEAMLTF